MRYRVRVREDGKYGRCVLRQRHTFGRRNNRCPGFLVRVPPPASQRGGEEALHSQVGVAAGPHPVGDLCQRTDFRRSGPAGFAVGLAQPGQPGSPFGWQIKRFGRLQELRPETRAAELEAHLRRAQEPASPASRVLAEFRRALQGGDRHRDRAATSGADRGLLQLRRHLLVGSQGRRRPMPHLAVGLASEYLGQRGVRGLALRQACRLVDRRAHQRMAKPQLGALDRQQVGGDARREGVDCHRFAFKDDGRVQHLSEDVGVIGGGVLGGGGQQQRAGSGRQARALCCECSFEACGQRQSRRQQGALIDVL